MMNSTLTEEKLSTKEGVENLAHLLTSLKEGDKIKIRVNPREPGKTQLRTLLEQDGLSLRLPRGFRETLQSICHGMVLTYPVEANVEVIRKPSNGVWLAGRIYSIHVTIEMTK